MRQLRLAFVRRALPRRLRAFACDEFDYTINISYRYRYLFVETPKAGCSTIKRTLQLLETDDDRSRVAQDVHDKLASSLFSPSDAPIRFLHSLRGNRLFTFAFVRSPYSRVLSAYLDKVGADQSDLRPRNARGRPERLEALGLPNDERIDFGRFLAALARQSPARLDPHWQPMVLLLRPDILHYDMLGRLESFTTDFRAVLARIGSPEQDIERYTPHSTNATARLREFYGAREKEIVDSVYREDFEHFEYARELPAGVR